MNTNHQPHTQPLFTNKAEETPCGCTSKGMGLDGHVKIDYCPLHASALEMLEALHQAETQLAEDGCNCRESKDPLCTWCYIKKAISDATGK